MAKNIFTPAFALLLTVLLAPLMAQCPEPVGNQRPSWTSGNFPKETETSYFEMVYVEGKTLDDARDNANTELGVRRANKTHAQNLDNLVIRQGLVCEYHEVHRDGTYAYWQLAQVAKNPEWVLPPVPPEYFRKLERKESIGLRPFIPGMAQLYKGSNVKGVVFIVGEIALIGGVAVTEVKRASAESKINTTFNVSQRKSYIDEADNMQNARNILIVGAAAFYVWNVIDGFVAKKPNDSRLAIVPYINSHSTGLALTLNFDGR